MKRAFQNMLGNQMVYTSNHFLVFPLCIEAVRSFVTRKGTIMELLAKIIKMGTGKDRPIWFGDFKVTV